MRYEFNIKGPRITLYLAIQLITRSTIRLSDISKLNATTLLSSHLPPARGINNELLSYLKDATQAPRFIGPDQAALEKMMVA